MRCIVCFKLTQILRRKRAAWNQDESHHTCATFCGDCGAALAFTLESAYFGRENGIPITQERLAESGRCFLRAFARLLHESDAE